MMNLERINYIISLYQKLNPNEIITQDTKIKNTPIWKLCEMDGGPHQRIKKWCEDAVSKLEANSDDNRFLEEQKKCYELFKNRNKKYGDSWKVLSIQSVANLIEMKMHRIANMNTEQLDPKTLDEFQDSVNYALMGLIKVNNKRKK